MLEMLRMFKPDHPLLGGAHAEQEKPFQSGPPSGPLDLLGMTNPEHPLVANEQDDFNIPLHEPEEPQEHPDWANWKQPHHGQGWTALTDEEREQMEAVGVFSTGGKGRNITDTDQYKEFLSRLRKGGFPPPNFAQGGKVDQHPGQPQGTDTVPAWLTPGEYVVNKDAASANRNELEGMNNAEYHAEGGLAGDVAKGAVSLGIGVTHEAADASSDPAKIISGFGQNVSAVGKSWQHSPP